MQLISRLAVSSLALHGRMLSMPMRTASSGVKMVDLLTEDAKAFHAIGYNIGTQIGELHGFPEDEIDQILSGIKLALLQEPPEVPLSEYVPKASEIMMARQAEKAKKAAAAGEEALKTASKEEGATTTSSGLVVLIETEGEGDSPTADQTVEVHYEGKLIDGTIFDSSYKRGETISFPLSGVIKGWTEGLQLMKPGGKAKLTIPSDLAYGDAGTGPIPGKAVLVFDVELLAVLE